MELSQLVDMLLKFLEDVVKLFNLLNWELLRRVAPTTEILEYQDFQMVHQKLVSQIHLLLEHGPIDLHFLQNSLVQSEHVPKSINVAHRDHTKLLELRQALLVHHVDEVFAEHMVIVRCHTQLTPLSLRRIIHHLSMSADAIHIMAVFKVRTDNSWSQSLTLATFEIHKKIKIFPNFNEKFSMIVNVIDDLHAESSN